jgi:two-component system OmpR family sensor kinase
MTKMTTMTTMTTTTESRRWSWVPSSLRTRTLAFFVCLLALAIASTVLVTRTVLLVRLDQRIDTELTQEAAELRRLASGNDPETGRPFGPRPRRIFEVFLSRNIPSRHEALITFVRGEPFIRSRQVVPYRLDREPELVAHWGSLSRPERGRVQTQAGRVEYLGVPLNAGGIVRGVFVAAIFRDRAAEETEEAALAAAAVGLAVLLLGSLLAWRLADRVVGPVSALTRTARTISETDFSRRIPVHGRDEVAQLAATFNQMLDRLEHAFASQRRFVDDAGHELKTPLTIVRGHLELLDAVPDSREQTVALVMDELDRMSRIVEDLLLLAKREQPDFLDLSTVEVSELTDQLQAKVRALDDREWALEARGRGVIVADRQRVTQAIVQLAQNAIRHGGADGPVALGSQVAGEEARFWVRDHGPGIPSGDRERIFSRFYRGAGGRRTEGAGLGLAIVRAIAEAHHGRVEIESEPDRGSAFTIVIPVDQPERSGELEP